MQQDYNVMVGHASPQIGVAYSLLTQTSGFNRQVGWVCLFWQFLFHFIRLQ